jgi:hypothetical protein
MAKLSNILTARSSQGPSNSFKNIIINGDMQVAQRATSVSSVTSGGYLTADRWSEGITTQGTWTISVENDAPTGSGFRKSLKWLCTTADASPAAGDNLQFFTTLEGQNLQHIKKGTAAAEQLTLSFWVKSNVTGTYIAELYDNDNARQTSKSYTISASGVWEYKTITFAADTTGAFDNDNALSLYVVFGLGAGSNFTSGTLQTSWATATTANRFVGQVNLASAISNYWQVTGIQLEVGDTATPHEFKPYAQDLLECMRYLQVWKDDNKSLYSGHYWSTTESAGTLPLKIQMRSAPTLTASSGGAIKTYTGVGQAQRISSSINTDAASDMSIDIFAITSSTTAGNATFNRLYGAGAYLWLVSEL